MPKKLGDISFIDLLPESISGDETVKQAAQALDNEIQDVNRLLEIPALYARLDELPEQVIDLLAWQLHVDFWGPDLPLDRKRELVKGSVGWHKYKGTPWAVKKLLADTGFTDAEVIEFWQARQMYKKAGGAQLDGTWTLGGPETRQLISYKTVVGLPYMGHWAEFCVRLNLVEARWLGWNKDLIQAVETAKPARSHPVWLYWLYLSIIAEPSHFYELSLTKTFALDYPWCTPQLDGKWSLGSGGYLFALDGSLKINGEWSLGDRTATSAQESLRQCKINTDSYLQKDLVRPERNVATRLGESKLRLDGGWQIGLNTVFPLSNCGIVKSLFANVEPRAEVNQSLSMSIDYPASPQSLESRPRLGTWRKVNGSWALSRTLRQVKLNGTWPIRREPGIITKSSARYKIDAETGLAVSLGQYKKLGQYWTWCLDGSWYIGARHDLDGTWPLKTNNLLGGKKLGRHYQGLNGTWKVGEVDKKLGSFRIGQPGPECESQIIIH